MGTHLECIYSTLRASQAKKAEENLFLQITMLVMVRKKTSYSALLTLRYFWMCPGREIKAYRKTIKNKIKIIRYNKNENEKQQDTH